MILFIRGTKNRLDANLIAGGAGLFWLKNCHEGKKLSFYFASRPTISVSILKIHFKQKFIYANFDRNKLGRFGSCSVSYSFSILNNIAQNNYFSNNRFTARAFDVQKHSTQTFINLSSKTTPFLNFLRRFSILNLRKFHQKSAVI